MDLDSRQQRRLALASALALEWHATQQRKGSDIPYVSHLLQVQGLVFEHGGDPDQAIAGLLHDALEDAETEAERDSREAIIAREFGADVLAMVRDCTDTERGETLDDKAPWKERKLRFLESIAAADARSLLVIACDKRHNLHALVWDVRQLGPGTLERFSAGPADQLWYFGRIVDVLSAGIPTRLRCELEQLLADFERLLD